MLTYNTNTPVLYIDPNGFNDPPLFLERIRNVNPKRVYLAGNAEFLESLSLSDWDSEIQTFVWENDVTRHEYVFDAVTWFFGQEEEGIILEGNHLPCYNFFGFCSELLEKYRHDERITLISGGDTYNRTQNGNATYYFSKLAATSGWAGWRRSWDRIKLTKINLDDFIKADYFECFSSFRPFKLMWGHFFTNRVYSSIEDVELRFMCHSLLHNTLTVIPTRSFMGYINKPDEIMEEVAIDEVIHPEFIIYDSSVDIRSQEIRFGIPVMTRNIPDGQSHLKDKLLSFVADPVSASARMKIPKIIHQIYEDPAGPSEMLLNIAGSWKEKNPEWEYRFWGKKEMNEFLEENFPEFIPVYKAYPYNVQRWDAIRYLILYKTGGLYVDFDYECIEPLDVLMCDATCCMGMEPTLNAVKHNKNLIVGNAFMASTPGHLYFKAIIQDLYDNHDRMWSAYGGTQIVESTGPMLTTRVYEQLSEEERETVTLLSADLVMPLTRDEVRMMFNDETTPEIEEKVEHAFAIHYFFGSWVEQTRKYEESKKVSEKLKI